MGTALVCWALCSMPARLGHWQKPNLQCLQRNDRAMIRQICNVRSQDVVTIRSNELLARLGIEDLTSFWRREGSAGMDMLNAPMVQSRQPFSYRLRESVGLGGPRWHESSWQRGIAESGSSRLSTLMIKVCGDLVWDLPCVHQASYLQGDPLMWMLSLYMNVNQKSGYDDDDWRTCQKVNFLMLQHNFLSACSKHSNFRCTIFKLWVRQFKRGYRCKDKVFFIFWSSFLLVETR